MTNVVLSEKNVTTRKPHECWGCAEEFPHGSNLKYVFQIWEGEPSSTYWCNLCDHLLDIDDCDDGYFEGDLALAFAESLGFDSVGEMRAAFNSGKRFG